MAPRSTSTNVQGENVILPSSSNTITRSVIEAKRVIVTRRALPLPGIATHALLQTKIMTYHQRKVIIDALGSTSNNHQGEIPQSSCNMINRRVLVATKVLQTLQTEIIAYREKKEVIEALRSTSNNHQGEGEISSSSGNMKNMEFTKTNGSCDS